jgi:YNFM family putative membrane transporter
MGAFVTIYNYTTFRLAAPPYQLSPTQVSLIFVVYVGHNLCVDGGFLAS